MAKYRKKPVVVEAKQFWPNKKPWPEGVVREPTLGTAASHYRVHTLEGQFAVSPGDWIITGVKGEKYPCKPDIFDMIYEPAEGT